MTYQEERGDMMKRYEVIIQFFQTTVEFQISASTIADALKMAETEAENLFGSGWTGWKGHIEKVSLSVTEIAR